MRPRPRLLLALALAAAAPAQDRFFAAQRTIVVANAASPFSLALANRYAALRHLPPEHIVVLHDVPLAGGDATPIPLPACTERILKPLLDWLGAHDLVDAIDCIAFSSGFPHAVDIRGLPQAASKVAGDAAALTGLAGFLRQTAHGDCSCIGLDANPFAARPGQPIQGVGFGADPNGRGRCYQSVMLTWLGPRGLGFAEALAGLERAAAADATNPTGTFYICKNGDIRSQTREPLFASLLDALHARGLRAELLAKDRTGQDGVVPIGKGDVLGAVVGAASFDWSRSNSALLPGAIAEHLTSFGATFQNGGQTKLTAWLRAGAAGSSGTVTEPFALQAKFPTPLLHAYYADGCTLGEAFWRSVAGPYQLLIVGDPACRPFAAPAPWVLPDLPAKWQGSVELTPSCPGAAGFEAWIDGRLAAATNGPGEPLCIDTTAFPDGPGELQLVAIGPPPVAVPTALSRPIRIDNHGLELALTVDRPGRPNGERISFAAHLPGPAAYELRAGSTILASGQAPRGTVRCEVDSSLLGLGESHVRLLATIGTSRVVSAPCLVRTEVAPIPEQAPGPATSLPGLAVDVTVGRDKPQLRGVLRFHDPLPIPPAGIGTVRGQVFLEQPGLYEWTCGNGQLQALRIGRTTVIAPPSRKAATPCGHGLVLQLPRGHLEFQLTVAGRNGTPPRLALAGPGGCVVLDAQHCGQPPYGLRPLAGGTAADPAWSDGDRAVARPPAGEEALFSFPDGVQVEALLLSFAGRHDADTLAAGIVIELGSGRSFTRLKTTDLRILHGEHATALLAMTGGRRCRQIRVRAAGAAGAAGALGHLSEIEAMTADGG